MSPLSVVCIVLGVVIILARAPLIVAPDATLRVYRKLVGSNARVRVIGVVLLGLGVPTVAFAWGVPDTAAQILHVFGWFLAVAGLLLLALPTAYRRIGLAALDFMSESMDSAIFRIVGLIAIAIGAVLIYAGLFVF